MDTFLDVSLSQVSGEKPGEVEPGGKPPDLALASNHPQCQEQYKVLLFFLVFELLARIN